MKGGEKPTHPSIRKSLQYSPEFMRANTQRELLQNYNLNDFHNSYLLHCVSSLSEVTTDLWEQLDEEAASPYC